MAGVARWRVVAPTGARTRGERWPIATIAALAAGATLADAARFGAVGERTLTRWKLDPLFLEAVREHRAEAVERSRAALVAASSVAVEALVDVARSGPPAARVAAARAILDHSTRLEPPPEEARLTEEEELKLMMDEGYTLEVATLALERTNECLTGPRRHLWRRFG